jgi:nucleoside-diphosphate-sugar epimerase
MMKHTILGAGGSIGTALTYELLKTNESVRLVSRSTHALPGTTSFPADITSYEETVKSVQDSDIVYLCAGLPYNSRIWNDLWPKIMRNAIDACKSIHAKLIFFDNVYMYGRVNGAMTETTPYRPCSRKGEVRAKIATLLEDEIQKKNIDAMIVRSADFYGPFATKGSIPFILAIDKMMKGTRAQWLLNADTLHSYTYTLDCAKGLRLLSSRDECYNQIWHLPTSNPAIDGKTFIGLIAQELGASPEYSLLKKWMVKMAGFFSNDLSEVYEMLYQNEFAYIFDSTKFNTFFNYTPTSYKEGIHETIEYLKAR